MSRPRRKRSICFWPKTTYFKPAGIPLKTLEEIELNGDELEAVRLKDLEGLEQEEIAKKMKVSRPTIVRVLKSARKKITQCLVEGKAIKLEKGSDIIFNKSSICSQNLKRFCRLNRGCGRTP